MSRPTGANDAGFSAQTLETFETTITGVPLRALMRAFEAAGLRPGDDPGGPAGSRREQFRRFVASVDQDDPQQVERLGDALGTLVNEVAVSKQDYLVRAAARDGFSFTNGSFRRAESAPDSFAIADTGDLVMLDSYEARLMALAQSNPSAAIAGAKELFTSTRDLIWREYGGSQTDEFEDVAPWNAFTRWVGKDKPKRVTTHHARLIVAVASAYCTFFIDACT